VSGVKTGRETAPGRQIGISTLKDRLRYVRKRKQAYDGLLVDKGSKQPLVGERRKRRDD
jgi:hypothetical protein